MVPEHLSGCSIINASGGSALPLILTQGRMTEIKAATQLTALLPLSPALLKELVLTEPVERRTHDKSLKGQWKRAQSVLKSQRRKKKTPQRKRACKINDLPTAQGGINTSWGTELSEAMKAMSKGC